MSEGRVERRLAAILAVDVAGYSRLMEADEEGTLAALRVVRRELGDPKIAEHRGRIVKTTGDGLLDPKLTIAGFRDLAHYVAPEFLELYVTGLRLAGLPEE
jgi:class 3 adenylate cyclase